MAGASASTYNLLRSLWPQKAIYDLIYSASPTIGVLPKDTSFYEKVRFIDTGFSAPQGVGPNFQIAKNSKTASKSVEFGITAVSYYGLFSIEGRLMRMSKGDKAAIVKPLARESKNVMTQWKRDLSRYIHGNGGGALGQMTAGSNPATATITLADPNTHRFFQQGMTLWTSATDGTSGAVKAGQVTIASIVRDDTTATITVNEASWNAGIPLAAASDFIFRAGVFGNIVTGFEGWNPVAAPSATLFFGVDRTPDTQMLGGIRIAAASGGRSPRESAIRAARMVADVGGSPDLYILSTTDWELLQLELQSAGTLQYTSVPGSPLGSYNFGLKYDAIKLMGPRGPIAVLADPDATVGVGRMLTRETWTLASTGELVSIIEGGGNGPGGMMMEDVADSWESRLVGDFQMYCEAPGYNARIAL